MGQEEVKKILKKSGVWLMSNEIARSTGNSLKSIQSSLRRLVKWGEIKKEPASKVIQDNSRLKEKSFAGYAYKIKDYKTLEDFKFEDKVVLLRLDLDSVCQPFFIPSENFSNHLPTLLELIEKKAKIVILTHQSSNAPDLESLEPHRSYLEQKLNKKVSYVDSILEKPTQDAISNLRSGEILLLKNLFSLKEEAKTKFKKQKKSKLVSTLSPLADFYVNDAFSLSHLSYTSLTGFPQVLPSCPGRYFEKEIETANHLLNPARPCVYILGGNKPYELLPLIKTALQKDLADLILTSGFLSHLFYMAQNQKLGGQEKDLKQYKLKVKSDLKNLLKNNSPIILPRDYIISTFGVRENIPLKNLPVFQPLQEIGEETLKHYISILQKAKTIFIKGTLGRIENLESQESTKKLFEEISKSEAFTFILGNSTVNTFKQFNIPIMNIKHLSKCSTPLLTYLSRGKLPSLDVLKTQASDKHKS